MTITATDASGDPVANATITLTAVAVANSGGHDHTANRPVGDFSGPGIVVMSPAAGTTNSSGMLVATYTATAFGGFETLIAKLTDTPDVSTSATLGVRVPGLLLTPPSGTPTAYNLTGQTSSHTVNHFATRFTIDRTTSAAARYRTQTDGDILGINDMSLAFGGLFDIKGNWQRPHKFHETGNSVDIDRCAQRQASFAIVDQVRLDNIMVRFDGVRLPESGKDLPCPGPSNTPRIHYEFP